MFEMDLISVTAQKRACNTATCVTHRLADFLSRSGAVGKNNFVPTNVGSKAFGRRRRSVQIKEIIPISKLHLTLSHFVCELSSLCEISDSME
ncbi:hypothetical protein EK904_007899 [Melospiza melodia maxima]|nr:hypothetical protein EK904_007899 [Melospiza melodia maxima]